MKLKALQSILGIKPQGEYTHAGEAFEVDEAEGQRLVDLGCAEKELGVEEQEPGLVADLELEPH